MIKINEFIKVVFVGDSPPLDIIDHEIPFIGTRSFNTLVKWIAEIQPDYYVVYNSDSDEYLNKIHTLYHEAGFKIVALGGKASNRLSCWDIPHFECDHPSGLNRNLNNKAYVDDMLKRCKEWLNNKENK